MPARVTDAINPELISALGRMVIQHSALEQTLRECILVHTAKEDDVAVGVLLTGQSFSTLVEKYGAIYYEFHAEHRQEIRSLCNRLSELNGQRNQMIHSFWRDGGDAIQAIRLKSTASVKKGLVLTASGVSPAEVEALALELHKAQEKLTELSIELTLL